MGSVTSIAKHEADEATEAARKAAAAYIESLEAMKDARDDLLEAIGPTVREEGMLEVIGAMEAAKAAHWSTKEGLRLKVNGYFGANAYGHRELRMEVGEGEWKTFYGTYGRSEKVKDRGHLAAALWDALVRDGAIRSMRSSWPGLSFEDAERVAEVARESVRELMEAVGASKWCSISKARKVLADQALSEAPDIKDEEKADLITEAIEEHIESTYKTRAESAPDGKQLGIAHSRWVVRKPELGAKDPKHAETQALRADRRALALAAERLGCRPEDLDPAVEAVEKGEAA